MWTKLPCFELIIFQGFFLSLLRGIKQISCLWNRETTHTHTCVRVHFSPAPKCFPRTCSGLHFPIAFPLQTRVSPGNCAEHASCSALWSPALHSSQSDPPCAVCGVCGNGFNAVCGCRNSYWLEIALKLELLLEVFGKVSPELWERQGYLSPWAAVGQLLHECCVWGALPSLAEQLPVRATDPCNSAGCGRSAWALCHSGCANLLQVCLWESWVCMP